jgi:hypothetical protein
LDIYSEFANVANDEAMDGKVYCAAQLNSPWQCSGFLLNAFAIEENLVF